MVKKLKWGMFCCFAIVTTGCWDRVEIESRGFVTGAVIDMEEASASGSQGNDGSNQARTRNFIATYQFVIPGQLQGNGGEDGKGGPGKAFINLTSKGTTITQIDRIMSERFSRPPYMEHAKMIIFSDRLAQSAAMPEALDFYLRNMEIRRATRVLVAKGNAREVMEVNEKAEHLPVDYIESTSRNYLKNARMLKPTVIGELHNWYLTARSFVLPLLTVENREAKLNGAAVFQGKTRKMLGYLNGDETVALNLLTNRFKESVLEQVMDGVTVVLELKYAKTSIQADATDIGHIVFNVKIDAAGNIAESSDTLDFIHSQAVPEIELKAAAELEKKVMQLVSKMQHDFKTDVIGLGDYLNEEHYAVWQKIKNNWDSGEHRFADCRVEVHAKIKITDTRAINKVNSSTN
ncbi:Ger(x)C family spore germination protein [Paenibacillus thalictri]|uniref:Ger(X)C family spore germination protein n=1 Tax=Paenibacillus thalictri TaxID=2527873 RepID=A0A4V2J4T4_9BACL|nr:Ger(x)C family spore germination protein [Paenibacillus thalictri]TBL81122.1 Ger(x)C family spore germination protein [Paenibacillus thalictri]